VKHFDTPAAEAQDWSYFLREELGYARMQIVWLRHDWFSCVSTVCLLDMVHRAATQHLLGTAIRRAAATSFRSCSTRSAGPSNGRVSRNRAMKSTASSRLYKSP